MKNSKFELEFCLKREAYCNVYNEDGSLWDSLHNAQMKLFIKVFLDYYL